MAVQRVDRAAGQTVIFREQVGQDFLLVEATVEENGDGPGDEFGQLRPAIEHELGDDFRAVLFVGHEFAGVDVVVDLCHRDAEPLGHLGE